MKNIFLTILLLLALFEIGYCKIWYVSNSGSNSNNGTEQFPFKTIDKAVDEASNMDSISLDKGEFNGANIIINKVLNIYGINPNFTIISCTASAFSKIEKKNGYSGLQFLYGGSLKRVMIQSCEPAVSCGSCDRTSPYPINFENVVFYDNLVI